VTDDEWRMSKPLVPPSADKSFGEIRGTTLHRCSGHELQNTDTIRFAELKHNPELQNRAAKSKTDHAVIRGKDNLRDNATVLQEFLRGGAALK
jgi:hypothetical protein